MKRIEIREEAGVKTWNGQTLETILRGLDKDRFDTALLENLFHTIESENAFVAELKKIREKHTTTNLLLYIHFLTNLSLREATDLLDKTL